MNGLGRTLIGFGLLLVATGVIVLLADRLPIRLGRLPGDILIRGRNSTFYFPVATSVLLSVVLSLLLWLWNRF